jgi:hydrogenase maturation factor
MLLQEVHVGSWLLVAGQTAHAVLDEHEAHEITALLQELGQLDQL